MAGYLDSVEDEVLNYSALGNSTEQANVCALIGDHILGFLCPIVRVGRNPKIADRAVITVKVADKGLL